MDNFDFNRIGKKTPYRVPDDFFDSIEQSILSAAAPRPRRRSLLKYAAGITATAAAVALLLTVSGKATIDGNRAGGTELAQAFDNLSDSDRDCLLEIYQDDIFINQL